MSGAHSEFAGAVRFPIPVGWAVQQQVVLQLPATWSEEGIDFQPNIVMVIRPLAGGATVEVMAEERWKALKQHLAQLERGLSLSGELFGERAVRMTYKWQQGEHVVQQVLVLCALEESCYEITFTDVTSRFQRSVIEFDRWLAALATATAAGARTHRGQDFETLWGTPAK